MCRLPVDQTLRRPRLPPFWRMVSSTPPWILGSKITSFAFIEVSQKLFAFQHLSLQICCNKKRLFFGVTWCVFDVFVCVLLFVSISTFQLEWYTVHSPMNHHYGCGWYTASWLRTDSSNRSCHSSWWFVLWDDPNHLQPTAFDLTINSLLSMISPWFNHESIMNPPLWTMNPYILHSWTVREPSPLQRPGFEPGSHGLPPWRCL